MYFVLCTHTVGVSIVKRKVAYLSAFKCKTDQEDLNLINEKNKYKNAIKSLCMNI